MPIFVSVDLYSGIPNPIWQLSASQENRLVKLLSRNKFAVKTIPEFPFWRLGYRGFKLQIFGYKKLSKNPIYVFHSFISDLDKLSMKDKSSEIEYFLLETGLNILTSKEQELVDQEIRKNLEEKLKYSKKTILKKRTDLTAGYPAFEPDNWNDGGVIQLNNNCYNYANNQRTDSFARPGKASGLDYSTSQISCDIVTRGSVADGLIQLAGPATPEEGDLICLVVSAGVDYHWYRLDNNNIWSHKPGQTPCTELDSSGNIITDPETADRGIYVSFCGYFNTIPSKINID